MYKREIGPFAIPLNPLKFPCVRTQLVGEVNGWWQRVGIIIHLDTLSQPARRINFLETLNNQRVDKCWPICISRYRAGPPVITPWNCHDGWLKMQRGIERPSKPFRRPLRCFNPPPIPPFLVGRPSISIIACLTWSTNYNLLLFLLFLLPL